MFYEKIVAIDDDSRSLESIKLVLQKRCEVVTFKSGEAALQYLKKPHHIRLVLVDVYMKGMDGISVLHEVKKLKKDIAVIVMSAFGSRDIVLQALRNDADDFLDKPFDIQDLKEKVRKFLHDQPVSSSSAQVSERIKNFIKNNYSSASLKDVAENMSYSEKHISRLFKKENNCSFRDYKVLVRIEKAKELLSSTSQSVQNISHELGYQNPETFMRVFKRKTGKTPLEFRNASQK